MPYGVYDVTQQPWSETRDSRSDLCSKSSAQKWHGQTAVTTRGVLWRYRNTGDRPGAACGVREPYAGVILQLQSGKAHEPGFPSCKSRVEACTMAARSDGIWRRVIHSGHSSTGGSRIKSAARRMSSKSSCRNARLPQWRASQLTRIPGPHCLQMQTAIVIVVRSRPGKCRSHD